MSEQELEDFRRRVVQSRQSRIATREVALKLLIDEGVVTPDGNLTERYGGTGHPAA